MKKYIFIEIFIIKTVERRVENAKRNEKGNKQYMTVEHDYMLSKHQTPKRIDQSIWLADKGFSICSSNFNVEVNDVSIYNAALWKLNNLYQDSERSSIMYFFRDFIAHCFHCNWPIMHFEIGLLIFHIYSFIG